MPGRQSSQSRVILLNYEGQVRLEDAFEGRTRAGNAFLDFADGWVRALEREGLLDKYLRPDIDPFLVLKTATQRPSRSPRATT